MNQKFVEVKIPNGNQEIKRVLEPFPEGPYYYAHQHHAQKYDGMSVEDARRHIYQPEDERYFPEKLFTTLVIPKNTWGNVYFYIYKDSLKRCLEHFDTSD